MDSRVRRTRELSDARGSGPRQGGGPGGGAPWLNTLEYQSTAKRQMTKNADGGYNTSLKSSSVRRGRGGVR